MLHDDWSATDAIALAVLRDHGGTAKLAEFLAAGLTPVQVAAVFRRAVIERPRSGWYADPQLPWQAKRAIRVGGLLACVSALDSFGLPVPPDSRARLHVLVPGNSARQRHNRDRTHHVVPGEDREVETHWSLLDGRQRGWRTPLIDALLHAADCVPEPWWIAALDAARHISRDGHVLLPDADWAMLCKRAPRRLRRALGLVDPMSESCIETLLRLGLIRRGIGPFVLQFSPDGRRFVDLLVGTRLIVEADGEAYHDAEKDAVRDAFFRGLGYTVLRFSYDRIVDDLVAVLDEIAIALVQLEQSR